MADWTIVIPVKGTAAAKSRLGASAPLARAIALDTVAAVVSVPELVARVIVVTNASAAPDFEALGASVVIDKRGGLTAAIASGLEAAGAGPTAVLLGDVPAVRPEELVRALMLAEGHPLGMVADADGDGTVLITALDTSDHRPAFGPDSRAAHIAAGYFELAVPHDSGLRRDVDTSEQLDALAAAGRLGFRTAAATK
ncbi:MAG: 2-phospho-L-lactate/phosphoenolpyruvate guanylyltransferase [Actinomycetota bacterium]|nr:2-phospho-L-lactate/phosphoenolpyruvate guanylyltransferase [Actinomycetota bacterium]